jgi:hypothetical protein
MKSLRQLIAIIAVVAAIATSGFIGIGLWFFVSHRSSVGASSQLAEIEFSQLRERFSNQQPLLDMSRRETSDMPLASQGLAPIRSFHTVVFDTRGGNRIVRIAVPYWFAHHFAGRNRQFTWLGQLTFLDDTEFDPEPIRLSLDQLERRGPGLVVYYRHSDGGQFISWVE